MHEYVFSDILSKLRQLQYERFIWSHEQLHRTKRCAIIQVEKQLCIFIYGFWSHISLVSRNQQKHHLFEICCQTCPQGRMTERRKVTIENRKKKTLVSN